MKTCLPIQKLCLKLVLATLPVFTAANTQALSILLNDVTPGGMAPAALAGFQLGASRWSGLFSDLVTVRIDVAFQTLESNVLGQAASGTVGSVYSTVKSALGWDATSGDDSTAVLNLPAGPYLSFLTTPPNGGAPVLDANQTANNLVLDVNRANAKALGLMADDGLPDAQIRFNKSFNFDFDPSDGIAATAYDFVGVATHEIGHALGFVSGVDVVDLTSGSGPYAQVDLNPYRVFSVLDLFRYSASALAAGPGVLDFAVGGTPYFSINGGLTGLGGFATGHFNGNAQQASHWKDNLSLGIMDPTLGKGEMLSISALDVRAYDVIGWDLANIPDPTNTFHVLALSFLGLLAFGRRSQD
ncbi:MAG: NF038122 family metalloprotease [Verrucomicrobia bacterium]|nr:NF038122 family metalloprotease [Verrucomicrobiota bacterium]